MLTLKDLGLARQTVILNDGVPLTLFERAGAPLNLQAVFYSGSRFDPVGKEGLAHIAEHMLTAGTKRYPTKEKLAAYIERYGGVFSASTGSELMKINISIGDPADIDVAIDVLTQILFEPALDEGTFASEVGSVLREYGNWQSSPARSAWEQWRETFFQASEMGRPALGTEKTIGEATLDDVRDYYDRMLSADRMWLLASGGVGIDQLVQKLERRLPRQKGHLELPSGWMSADRREPIGIKHYDINDQVDFIYGFRTLQDTDKAALDLLAAFLGGGRAATLTRILRQEKGLIYSLMAHHDSGSDQGSWYIKTASAKDKLGLVLASTNDELGRIAAGGMSADELEFAKDKLIKSKRMQLQSSEAVAALNVRWEVYGSGTFDGYMRHLAGLSLDDVTRAARQTFNPDHWYMAACGDIEAADLKVDW